MYEQSAMPHPLSPGTVLPPHSAARKGAAACPAPLSPARLVCRSLSCTMSQTSLDGEAQLREPSCAVCASSAARGGSSGCQQLSARAPPPPAPPTARGRLPVPRAPLPAGGAAPADGFGESFFSEAVAGAQPARPGCGGGGGPDAGAPRCSPRTSAVP
eukprot:TRINITY_DN7697_c0_g1_i35.p3 TRINITY_DN7697_c0_g1~~TRINITY_DN7697_c0_g1_i35.p3  ORF type:complete len:158 (+),score=14.79 TRINITY_DN7697_c0_g1_i35:541-1014(+)